jgi:CheY-like chemotaxis protein
VAITILVADDSATMRRIFEMTFAGEDARVVTAPDASEAMRVAAEVRPDVVIADLSMNPDGYELARSIKGQFPGTAVVALSSQHTPYDDARGRDAGVDDNIVKPFDTTNVIERITKLAANRPAAAAQAHPYRDATAQPASPAHAARPAAVPAAPAAAGRPAAAPAAPGPAAARPGVPRTTVAFGSAPGAAAAPRPAAPVAVPVAVPAAARPQPAAAAPAAAASAPRPATTPQPAPPSPAPAASAGRPASAAAPAIAAASADLALKLDGLGLTSDQATAVLALSREVIERVVWEVVPDLAETIIREEIRRLTAG